MPHKEKTIKSTPIFNGRIFDVVLDEVEVENGNIYPREVIYHNGAVAILAINENDEVYLVKQYRYPIREEIYEIPAGKLEKDEVPLECAIRELEEEIGMKANSISCLGKMYSSPGCLSEIIHLYLATDLTKTQQNLDVDEFLDVECVPISQVLDMIMSEKLADAKSQLAILKYLAMTNEK